MAALSSVSITCLHSQHRNESSLLSSKRLSFPQPLSINWPPQRPRFSISHCLKKSGDLDERETQRERGGEGEEEEEEEEEYWIVTAVKSSYNQIVIVDSAKSRYLLLDSTQNVHSVINKGGGNWTESYWDEFASLPAIIPEGPIAIYGLGGGTAVRLMLELWPSLQLEGWEIDQTLIEKARAYMGLSELEEPTSEGGRLHVRVEDALAPSLDAYGKYAGIIVDLFSDGKILTQLLEVPTWKEIGSRLMPNGRIMVNCAGIKEEKDTSKGKPQVVSGDSAWMLHSTIKTLCEAFPGQVCWKRTPDPQGLNFMALTGGLPDQIAWSNKVPIRMSEAVKEWKLCQSFP